MNQVAQEVKKVIRVDGENMTVEEKGCNPLHLEKASKTIDYYWWDVIREVFSYNKERNAGMQEIHKIFTDDRVLAGYELYKAGIKATITDVDVLATINDYTVIIKDWKAVELLRYRFEMIRYIEGLFFKCTCQDHVITGNYRSNSSLACKHICAVLWQLQQKHNMPKIFVTHTEKIFGYQKSDSEDIVKDLYGIAMKKFTPKLHVVALNRFKETPMSLSYSIHRIPNEKLDYDYQPVYVTFSEIGKVKEVIKGSIDGLKRMMKDRGSSEEDIQKEVDSLFPEMVQKVEVKPKITFWDKIKDYFRM